ncbi:MAG: phosphate acyltransferase PlsX [Oceanococcaceae bacterium]
MRTLAIDGMGGDHGPEVVVEACALALRDNPGIRLLIVGRPENLEGPMQRHGLKTEPRCSLRPATEVVGMDEEPAKALRQKKDSSMRVALDLVAQGQADAAVSAGNTGALMATARFVLKMIPGIDRPAIMSALPSVRGLTQVLDLGANTECTAEQLLQFARMGSAASRILSGEARPSVGLLNIGSEAIKGNAVVKQTAELLRASSLNFHGYVEGNDIYHGTVDVVVCDGFTGNIMLKASEGLARLLMDQLKGVFAGSLYGRMIAVAGLPILKKLKKELDPGQYNGASLVGLRGVVVKSHGGADAPAFANAIKIAALEAEDELPRRIAEALAEDGHQPQAGVVQAS